MRADTIRWRGVQSAENRDGLSILDLRDFLADVDELAAQLESWAGLGVPVVLLNEDATIRHIWVGVQRRRIIGGWRRRGAGDVVAGPTGEAAL